MNSSTTTGSRSASLSRERSARRALSCGRLVGAGGQEQPGDDAQDPGRVQAAVDWRRHHLPSRPAGRVEAGCEDRTEPQQGCELQRLRLTENQRPTPVVSSGPHRWRPRRIHGIVGEIVRAIEPETEADPAALLFQLLAAAGNILGAERLCPRRGRQASAAPVRDPGRPDREGPEGHQLGARPLAPGDGRARWASSRVASGLSSRRGRDLRGARSGHRAQRPTRRPATSRT